MTAHLFDGMELPADELLASIPGGDTVVAMHPQTQQPITMHDVCVEQAKLLGQVKARAQRFARSANPRVKAEGNDLLRLLGHDH